MDRNTIAVIGGGAAGMMAAITAAREGGKVTLYERNDRLGKKLLATGNGKCNLGNQELSEECYYGGNREFIGNCLKRFDQEDAFRFFKGIGLLVRERNGYRYPAGEQASAVLDVLRFEMQALGARIITGKKIDYIEGSSDRNHVLIGFENQKYEFDRVILACGSKAAPKTGSDGIGYRLAEELGHTIRPVVPALVQLKCRDEYCKAIAGVRADAAVRVLDGTKTIACERGEVQFTDYGISGIPVFQFSRTVNYRLAEKGELDVRIDFLPDYSQDAYEQMRTERFLMQSGRCVEEFFTGMLHKKVMTLLIKLSGLKTSTPMENAKKCRLEEVFRLCRDFPLHISGSNSYDHAQVCAGGVDTREVTQDLESVKVPGVYFAGELLDVDGRCGGYNLQWAWTSGYLAGLSAARRIFSA